MPLTPPRHERSLMIRTMLALGLVLAAMVTANPAHAQESPLDTPAVPDAPGSSSTEDAAIAAALASAFAGPSAGMTVVSQSITPTSIRSTARFSAIQDSYISSAFQGANFGSSATLFLGWNGANQQAMRMLLQFDLNAIPRDASITAANFAIYQTNVNPPGDFPMTFRAQYMRQAWNEGGVNWSNANFLGGESLPFGEVNNSIGWRIGPALGVTRAWVSRQVPNFGLLITGDETPSRNRFRQFASRESPGLVPYLEVTWETNCDNVAPTATINGQPAFRPLSFLLEWSGFDSAPGGCEPSGISSYDVEYSINGSSWIRLLSGTSRVSATFDAAGNGQYVQFRVRATDNAGNVQSFTGAQAATTVDGQAPSSSMNPLPAVTTDTSGNITWSGSDNLSGIATYDVQVRRRGEQWVMLVENTAATSFFVTGGEDGVTYEFRVRARDNVGNVEPWPDYPEASTTVSLYAVATVLPFSPPVVQPATPDPIDFLVRWQGVGTAAAPITSYTIHYRRPGATAWTPWQTFPANQTSARFPFKALNLPDGIYGFQAVATNSAGRVEPLSDTPEAQITLDLAGSIQVSGYFPILMHQPLP